MSVLLKFRKVIFNRNASRYHNQRYISRSYTLKSGVRYWNDKHVSTEITFDKILIANRGEIACRVIDSCRRLGIRSVAVYSEADSRAKHVQMADEAICVGPAPANESYLVVNNILKAIISSGAQAVHPGYGFLSENMEFAEKLDVMGVKFIGPSSEAIKAMGDKIASKRIAANAGVRTIPGFDGEVKDVTQALKITHDIGYPVMVKASAGGGGKGMRVAWNDDELEEGFRLSRSEAMSSFADDRMLIEKFVDKPRHIEVQILADNHGNVVYLNERECSVQRRNQKVIEEAPSVFVSPDMRKMMGEQAIALARAVRYTSAGTVEFLVDGQKNFYFLEMNTRLQVEHPITEYITGVDIVHQMIRIASGLELSHTQDDIPVDGWAVEARVYAEDPYRAFGLPSVGRLSHYVEPTQYPWVRCDSGVMEGSEISIYYDPMICKLVCYGKDREEALKRIALALDYYVIKGVTHNIPLLRDIVTEPLFVSGNITTDYLPQVYPEGFKGKQLSKKELCTLLAVSACVQHCTIMRDCNLESERISVTRKACVEREFVASLDKSPLPVRLLQIGPNDYEVSVGDFGSLQLRDFHMRYGEIILKAVVDGDCVTLQLLDFSHTGDISLQYLGTKFTINFRNSDVASLQAHMKEKPKMTSEKNILAPMPGLIKSIGVEVGQSIAAGMEVCVVEAMKMQNTLKASSDGVIKVLNFKAGDSVDENDIIVELE